MWNSDKREMDEGTLRLAAADLAARLPEHAVVWLTGDLGAGKTTMVRAMTEALGATIPATSPTYSLVHRYESPAGPLFHVDCYRLKTPEEARDLDWEGLAAGRAVFIEWPERAGAWALRPTLTIHLDPATTETRRLLQVS
jgi:tRNA threonylcarbamoyladenosine biosynthesis protein TsaE